MNLVRQSNIFASKMFFIFKLNILDNTTITVEERFQAKYFSRLIEHLEDYRRFQFSCGTI
jgi:hypothetical protein